jgi:hypothetical protein
MSKTGQPDDFSLMDPGQLLDAYNLNAEIRDSADRAIYEIKAILKESMLRDGATEIPLRDGVNARLTETVKYNSRILAGVKELISPDELISSGALIPEHQKTVPEQFNATKLKGFAKRGRDVAKIINQAREVSNTRVQIREIN